MVCSVALGVCVGGGGGTGQCVKFQALAIEANRAKRSVEPKPEYVWTNIYLKYMFPTLLPFALPCSALS